MASINKVILVGNLGKDPEIRYLPGREAVAGVTLATSNKYKNRNGEMVDETEWHNITFFGRLAEIAGQYLKKGSSIYVEGRIKTEKYTDKNGIEKYATKIIAGEMKMLGSRSSGGSDASFSGDSGGYDAPAPAPAPRRAAPARSAPPAAAPAPATRQAPPARPASNFDDMDDDIPF
jgi:single-strand DNA-binding protein